MKTNQAPIKDPKFRFFGLVLFLFLLPVPFIYLGWMYFGEPRGFALFLFVIIPYGSYFAVVNHFLSITSRVWQWAWPKNETPRLEATDHPPAVPPTPSMIQPIQQTEVKEAENQGRVFVGENVTHEYLFNIFRAHTAIQETKLTAAYLGKWMKVSGTVGEVISTNPARAQLTFKRPEVPFTERTAFYYADLFMMFDEPWVDRLAILIRGDKLTVIGQIGRIDGTSIHLENCELVGTDSK
jgi:hypothetical protein